MKKNFTTKETFALALQNHQEDNLQVAKNLYRKILKINPNHFESISHYKELEYQLISEIILKKIIEYEKR